MREIHALGKTHGLDHDRLKRYYQDQGFDSMTDMTVPELQALARNLRDDPDVVVDRLRELDNGAETRVEENDPDFDDDIPDAEFTEPDMGIVETIVPLVFTNGLTDLVDSGRDDVKDWELLTRAANQNEEAWVLMWDAAPSPVVANMLRVRMREEGMNSQPVKDARERCRVRLMREQRS